MPAFAPWDLDRATTIVTEHAGLQGATLPILHALQDEFGFVHKDVVPVIAEALNLSRAEIHGTISFYHDFKDHTPGRHVLKLCRAEACQAMGADALHNHCKTQLGIDWHGTTADGALTLEPVFCLGLCAIGPAALLDGKPLARLDPAKADKLMTEARA